MVIVEEGFENFGRLLSPLEVWKENQNLLTYKVIPSLTILKAWEEVVFWKSLDLI